MDCSGSAIVVGILHLKQNAFVGTADTDDSSQDKRAVAEAAFGEVANNLLAVFAVVAVAVVVVVVVVVAYNSSARD